MDLKSCFLSFALLLFSYLAFAQSTALNTALDSSAVVYGKKANDYIYIYKNRITAKAFYIKTSNSLVISGREGEDVGFNLYPNKQDKIGAAVAFRSLSASYSFSPNSLAENPNDKDSKLFNLNIRTYLGKHWMQTLDIYNQKGFYLDGHIEDSNSHIYLQDTKSFKIGGATSYIFNENFSYRALANQTEKQLKSAGTFIPTLVYYYTRHNVLFDDEFGNREINTKIKSYNIAIAPSYQYNYIPTKNVFISLGASAGLGLNFSSSKNKLDALDNEDLTSLLTEINFNGSITYDIDSLYFGAHYNYLILNYNADSFTYIKDNIPYFQAFVGYRFKASNRLVQRAENFNDNLIP